MQTVNFTINEFLFYNHHQSDMLLTVYQQIIALAVGRRDLNFQKTLGKKKTSNCRPTVGRQFIVGQALMLNTIFHLVVKSYELFSRVQHAHLNS